MARSGPTDYDAVIVGAGPNGLAAAITLAQGGLKVLVIEGKATVGGGLRTQELTLPGYHHDVCSAIHPLGMGSPFFKALALERYGLEWIQPDIPVAHPFDDGTAAALWSDFGATAATLGRDGQAWQRTFAPLAAAWEKLAPALLGPRPISRHLIDLGRFGISALQPAAGFATRTFATERGRALFAGLAAHAIRPL
ncbi:MAG: NAD(P)/FAD-dependent oxidoreductase, partial [Caldilineaceae bacterium]|nr:NAD(P)/FAD-dependent oxidoreductase [Caldilineaceae bacterium]